ncbi:MAG: flagellar type III secretion system protein FliQ [Armatimonadetes bacterium]|nr:flagellar type III secretion system protein FliQ [Armatimonadota bacterium]NIM24338.1 flagellar type III secretion system protein FliQ [Armatimonadota bacterium]NIM68207.1 flagellar type III secretion system protein FliQ [Armatimonadota bacterium]NIM75108.1 flagellar type III secretion system protein FliQ [Armatimonadota bacterium]NIN06412.1 flagellar type III secretion system protein FliQ [Armatimonadota bacterium]
MATMEALELGRSAITTGLMLVAPLLITGLLTGLFVSVLLAATQIQEFTLTFIPKILMMALAALICGPWMLRVVTTFTTNLLSRMAQAGN